jgi:hypothetical protein
MKSVLAGLAMALVAVLPAEAQRFGGGERDRAAGTWELLGEERVGFGADRDRLEIKQDERWWREKSFRSLRFVAQGGDIKIRRIILNYQNGHTEELDFKGDIRAGAQIDVPLRGERSYIAAINFDYASQIRLRFGSGGIGIGQATMRVYGENMRSGPPPRPVVAPAPSGPRWDALATQRFDRRDDRVQMDVGRREGRIGQVRLVYNGDGGVVIREMRVRFGNGESQIIPLSERLEDGYSTKGIDLEGDRRFIERVTVILDPRQRPGRANFTLEGNERPGRDLSDGPRRGEGRLQRENWELLGRATVGFERDRDIIRINGNQNWWEGRGGGDSRRGIDKLHFTAENSEIYMGSIRVQYINGAVENVRIDRLIQVNGDLVVDLPGERAFIREIEMNYRSRPGYRGQAIVSVFAERPRR